MDGPVSPLVGVLLGKLKQWFCVPVAMFLCGVNEYKIPLSVMPYIEPESYRQWMEGVRQAKANPAGAVTNFVESYGALVAAVEQAITEGEHRQIAGELDESAAKNLASWQTHTLPLLRKHLAAIQAGAEQFRAGDAEAILSCADGEEHLAKNLDGYWMPFAPQLWQQINDTHVDRVVRTAALVCAGVGAK